MVRTLTNGEYLDLAQKAWRKLGLDPERIGPQMMDAGAVICKQVHRLLCDGQNPNQLAPGEQVYTSVFESATLVKIPNDYGWEPGVKVHDEPVQADPPPKPKKGK